LGAVATLQQKGPTLGDLGKLAAQLTRLAGEDQWRITGQGLLDPLQVGEVRVDGLLLDRLAFPALGAPGVRHRTSRLAAIQADWHGNRSATAGKPIGA